MNMENVPWRIPHTFSKETHKEFMSNNMVIKFLTRSYSTYYLDGLVIVLN